jgi:hypothetical protein
MDEVELTENGDKTKIAAASQKVDLVGRGVDLRLEQAAGEAGAPAQYPVYTRRWLILALFVAYSASNAFQVGCGQNSHFLSHRPRYSGHSW